VDNLNIEAYVLNFTSLILMNVNSMPECKEKISPSLLDISENDLLIFTTEFLFYELHVCDRWLFCWYGAKTRKKIMDMIVTKIALVLNNNREHILDERLKSLDIGNLKTYLNITGNLPDFETIIEAYNQRGDEYSKFEFTNKKDESFNGFLPWEFAKKLASLINKEDDAFLEMGICSYAMGIYEMIVKFKDELDKRFNLNQELK